MNNQIARTRLSPSDAVRTPSAQKPNQEKVKISAHTIRGGMPDASSFRGAIADGSSCIDGSTEPSLAEAKDSTHTVRGAQVNG